MTRRLGRRGVVGLQVDLHQGRPRLLGRGWEARMEASCWAGEDEGGLLYDWG